MPINPPSGHQLALRIQQGVALRRQQREGGIASRAPCVCHAHNAPGLADGSVRQPAPAERNVAPGKNWRRRWLWAPPGEPPFPEIAHPPKLQPCWDSLRTFSRSRALSSPRTIRSVQQMCLRPAARPLKGSELPRPCVTAPAPELTGSLGRPMCARSKPLDLRARPGDQAAGSPCLE